MSTGKEFTPTEELILQQLADLSFVTGDILYYDGSQLQRLGIGSSGRVLTVSGGIPAWSPAGGGLTLLTATGIVNGSNTAFTFVSAPSIIFRDGVPMQKTSSDGSTTNWTGTTSVTLTLAPNSDIFGL